MPSALDITGKRFGKLVALKRVLSKNGKTYWLCQCDCGNQKEIQTGHLTSGVTTSCGCEMNHNKGQHISTNKAFSVPEEEFINFVKTSYTIKDVARACGYTSFSGAVFKVVKERIDKLNLDTSHFTHHNSSTNPIPDEEVFKEDSKVAQITLRRRVKDIPKRFPYKCAICGQEPIWNGKPLSLTLDHINGHNGDNRYENLRWICPNCDRQLDTFGSRNIAKKKKEEIYEDNLTG